MKKYSKQILSLLTLVVVSIVIAQINLQDGLAFALALPVGFAPLKWAAGSENMGGFKNRLLFIPAASVTAAPDLPTTIAAAEDLVTAEGSFTFSSEGDKPIFIYATDKTVKLDAENQGEVDGQSFVQKGEFFHPGSKADVAAFARKVNNTPGYLILEGPDGTQYMVGTPGLPCTIKPAFNGGAARSDRKGFLFTFEADSFCPFVILGTPIDFDAL
jgi:hypothetical protein